MAWIFLGIAVLGEIAWGLTLKLSDGYTHLRWSIVNMVLSILNVLMLSRAMMDLPVAISYGLWVGLGAVGVTIGSAFLFGEQITVVQCVFIAVVLFGVIGLKVFSPA
jgi:quaternary ammonium compound-resistance protein SugE